MDPTGSFAVADSDAGARLDHVVARLLGVSRGYARKLISAQRVLLEGRPAAKGTGLRAGERIEVLPFARPEDPPLANASLAWTVVAELAGWVAIDKPAGQPTHPLEHTELDTSVNALIAHFPAVAGVGEGGLRCGVVHRLDPGTSGVLVFALHDDAWRRARSAFRERRVAKHYVARVHGAFTGERELELLLESRGPRARVVSRGGRPALSRVRALATGRDESTVEIEMLTGVRHQIRATLAHLGHPVVGDSLYGSTRELSRHLLHAQSIRWDEFAAQAPLPGEFDVPLD